MIQKNVEDYYDSFLASEPGKYSSLAEFNARYEPILSFLSRTKRGIKILDIGCGTGKAAERLKIFGTVCGVDISPNSITQAAKVLDEAKIGTAEGTTYSDKSFDVVVCTETLEHVPDIHKAIREFHRVLAPRGYMLVSTPNPWNWLIVLMNAYGKVARGKSGTGQIIEHYISPITLRRVICVNGFKVIDYSTVFFRPHCVKWLSPIAGLYQICIAQKTT